MNRRRLRTADEPYSTAPLSALHDIIWSLLTEAVRDASTAFHTPALATVRDGEPDARTVVLRHADPKTRQVSCHTDWRSPKRSQVEAQSRVAWMFYDRARKIQLRLRGQVQVHNENTLTRKRWSSSPRHSRMCYSSPLGPGTPIQKPTEAPPNAENGEQNFTVLTCAVDYMDWLFLHAAGHRRAVLQWHENAWATSWVVP